MDKSPLHLRVTFHAQINKRKLLASKTKMAEAAFKSTSRRSTSTTTPTTTTNSSKKPPPRRSRSVSAVPRSIETTPSSPSSSPSTEFLVTRENPLYWTSSYSPPGEKNSTSQELKSADFETSTRGRTVGRSGSSGESVGGRRSLSRAPPEVSGTGRRGRSVSRGPASRGPRSVYASESEVEQGGSNGGLFNKFRDRNDSNGRMPMAGRKDDLERGSSFTWLDGLSSNLPSSPRLSWEENGVSSRGSFSEAEERTINKAVYEKIKSFEGGGLGIDPSSQIYETVRSEVRRAIADIQNGLGSAIRSNASAIATVNVTDIPPDLVNPSAVELILDIRREYANKLEQSRERARKLRADLDVEERRGLELSRILKEVLPDPKPTNVQRSRTGRKSSIERRRMSERLTEEAMAYFDECVSISTFDSSDFSSPEDPPFNLFGGSLLGDGSSSSQPSCLSNSHTIDRQETVITGRHNISAPSASSIPKEHLQDEASLNRPESIGGCRSAFSFGSKAHNTFELQQEIRSFLKNDDRGDEKANTNLETRQWELHDPEKYMRSSPESLLFDMVNLKNRIDSGGMLLCGGGFLASLSRFAPLI